MLWVHSKEVAGLFTHGNLTGLTVNHVDAGLRWRGFCASACSVSFTYVSHCYLPDFTFVSHGVGEGWGVEAGRHLTPEGPRVSSGSVENVLKLDCWQ